MKNYLGLFDPIRDTFDSIRSRSLFCFTVIIYLASRAVVDLRSDTHMQRVLQDEAQRLAEDSFFERPTKLETVQGMILLAAYSEKTWFSTALILRTALDSGLEKSLDRLLSQEDVPRSSLSASMADRQLVWQTRTWLISFTLELDVASGTGRKSRIGEVDIMKLRKFLDYPLSLPSDMRTVCIVELHQLRGKEIFPPCYSYHQFEPSVNPILREFTYGDRELRRNTGYCVNRATGHYGEITKLVDHMG